MFRKKGANHAQPLLRDKSICIIVPLFLVNIPLQWGDVVVKTIPQYQTTCHRTKPYDHSKSHDPVFLGFPCDILYVNVLVLRWIGLKDLLEKLMFFSQREHIQFLS